MKSYDLAPNALFRVSERMAAKLFVMTATNKLMIQKLRTTMQMMKNREETKKSESMTLYITGDHCNKTLSIVNII